MTYVLLTIRTVNGVTVHTVDQKTANRVITAISDLADGVLPVVSHVRITVERT